WGGARLGKREGKAGGRGGLALCAVESLAERNPGQLWGGQQQRVALARALAVRPTFLFLDEPFTSLDLVTKSRLMREIADLASCRQLTLVMVTHDPLEAFALCASAVVLEQGRVTEAGPLADLLKAPRSEMLTAFRDYPAVAGAMAVGRPGTGQHER